MRIIYLATGTLLCLLLFIDTAKIITEETITKLSSESVLIYPLVYLTICGISIFFVFLLQTLVLLSTVYLSNFKDKKESDSVFWITDVINYSVKRNNVVLYQVLRKKRFDYNIKNMLAWISSYLGVIVLINNLYKGIFYQIMSTDTKTTFPIYFFAVFLFSSFLFFSTKFLLRNNENLFVELDFADKDLKEDIKASVLDKK